MIRSFITVCLMLALTLEPIAASATEYQPESVVTDAQISENESNSGELTEAITDVTDLIDTDELNKANDTDELMISENDIVSGNSMEVNHAGTSENVITVDTKKSDEPHITYRDVKEYVSDPDTGELWLTRDEHNHVSFYCPQEIETRKTKLPQSISESQLPVSSQSAVSGGVSSQSAVSAQASATRPEPPKFSVPGGRIQEGYGIRLTTQTLDADIYYTTDGTKPTTNSLLYGGHDESESNEDDLIYVPGHVSSVEISAVAVSANKMSSISKVLYSVSPYEIEINQNDYKHSSSLSRLGCFVSYEPIQGFTTGEAMPYQLYHVKLDSQNRFQASLTATGFNGEIYLLDYETHEVLTYDIATASTYDQTNVSRNLDYVNQTQETKDYLIVVTSGRLSSKHSLGKAGANGAYQLTTKLSRKAVSISVNLAADYVVSKRTLRAYASTYPGDANEVRYDWSLRNEDDRLVNEDIAKISPSGVVTIKEVSTPRIMKVRATNRADSTVYGEAPFTVYPRVEKISSIEKQVSLTLNGTKNSYRADENFTIEPASGYYDSFYYTSSNPRVVTVDQDTGLVKAVGKGSAVIYKKAKDGSLKYGSFTVKVTKIVTSLTIVPGPKATTIKDNYPVVPGCYLNLKADVGPTDANNKTVKFMNGETGSPFPDGVTLKGNYLYVSKDARPLENFSIKVVAQDGGDDGAHGKTTIRTFCIFEKPAEIEVSAEYGITTINTAPNMHMKTTLLKARVYNKEGTCERVTQHIAWSSQNPAIATVDEDGLVTAKKKGKVKIIAKAMGGTNVAKSIEITVLDGITNMVIHPKNMPANEDELYPIINGKTIPLTLDMTPANPSNSSVTWSITSTASGASINPKTGAVTTPRSYNRTSITVRAESNDGTGTYAMATLRAVPAIDKIEIREAPKVLNTATQPEDIVEVLVTGHSDAWRELEWTSSDPSIASVEVINEIKARVTAHKKGKVRITATAMDGTKRKASTVIQVIEPLEKFVIAANNGAASIDGEPICISGKSTKLIPVQTVPEQPTNKNLTWSFLEEDPTKQVKINSSTGAVTVSKDLAYPKEMTVVALVKSGSAVVSQNILIRPATKSINLVKSQKKIGLYPGVQYTLNPTSNPQRAYSEYEFYSTDPTVVTVSETGTLTAMKKGTARISIRARDGSGVVCTSQVTVY